MNVLWYKRDLRTADHPAAAACIEDPRASIAIAIVEPKLWEHPARSARQKNFMLESIKELQSSLRDLSVRLLVFHADPLLVFQTLHSQCKIETVYSMEETGLDITYRRDRALQVYFKSAGIKWREYQSNGVQRGRRHRATWTSDWHQYMDQPQQHPDWSQWRSYSSPLLSELALPPADLSVRADHVFQVGGESVAQERMAGFLRREIHQYQRHISKPLTSREYCSRLSPYLAWGCLSIRQVYQALEHEPSRKLSRSERAFGSRLRWHCHFIQKFEMECSMEFRSYNRGYRKLAYNTNETQLQAWKDGNTGYPLVDATMRCVQETGYINFRMRAMLVSFLCNHLWMDWRLGVEHLGALFLDFEPGIHYPQFQMQAGITGINTIRVYNPIKQALDHDPDASFITRWIPELRGLPAPFAREPWRMTQIDQQFAGFQLGRDYPHRIIDIEETGRRARQILWDMQSDPEVIQDSRRILRTLTNPVRNNL